MGIHLAYISTDEVFYSTSSAKIVVNDLANSTLDDKAKVNDLLMLEVGVVVGKSPWRHLKVYDVRSATR